MTTERGRARAASFPHYHVDAGLDLRLETFALDDGDTGPVPGESAELELFEYGSWNRARVTGSVLVSEGVVERTFPADERDDPPAEVFLVFQCGDSLYRRGERLSAGTLSEGGESVVDVEFELERADYVGEVEVEPVMVRTDTGSSSGDGYAAFEGLEVADGDPWSIHVDEPEETPGNRIPAHLKSFAETHVDDEDLFHVRRSPPHDPEIWVNSDNPGVADVLQSGGYHGFRPRLRKVILRQVAHPALVELVLWTASDLDPDGQWQYDWQQGVLVDVCQRMYDVDDPELVAERVHDAYHDDVGQFTNAVNSAVQKHLEADTALEEFIENEAPR